MDQDVKRCARTGCWNQARTGRYCRTPGCEARRAVDVATRERVRERERRALLVLSRAGDQQLDSELAAAVGIPRLSAEAGGHQTSLLEVASIAKNDGEHPVREIFPGISIPDTTGAMGSAGGRSSPGGVSLAGESGLPGIGVVMPLGSQADPGTDSTLQPGQTAASAILPGPAEGYVSSGAASGSSHSDAWPRYDWQQSPGGQ